MKIAVIGFNNFISMPYMRFYKRLLDDNGISADYYCWNREKNTKTVREENGIVKIGIQCKGSRFWKLFAMIKWKRKILKLLRKEKYDRLIVLTSLPAFLLKGYLLRNYKNRYIFDIRDFTYDNFRFYKNAIGQLCRNSAKSFISSEGFKRMLKESENVIPIHNVDIKTAMYGAPDLHKKNLTIGYVGLVKYYESNVYLLNQLKNLEYRFCYYGIYEDNRLQKYCIENGFENVYFYGQFDSEEKNNIYRDIDFVNCYFGKNRSFGQSLLLPNRMYDAIYSNRPIITNEGSFFADCVQKYNLGIVLSDHSNIQEQIQKYIQEFDEKIFLKGISDFKSLVEKQQAVASNEILNFCRGGEAVQRIS